MDGSPAGGVTSRKHEDDSTTMFILQHKSTAYSSIASTRMKYGNIISRNAEWFLSVTWSKPKLENLCVQEFYALNTWRHRTRIHTSVISSILKSINDMATFLNLWKQHHPLHILVQNRGVEDQIGWFHLSRCETAPGTAANHVLGMIMDELMYPESIRRCSITWLLVHPSRSWFPEQLMSLKPSWYNW